ncbi:unnamed protein product [Fusarium equiseti]|uniref:RRM domain-containing protein n=1 Tax=Fusarium equiseti TaxID=61235 RepID=A0A8J2N6D5_FUSEQ|nr:unnamed protein product [Fusarium equiseti]
MKAFGSAPTPDPTRIVSPTVEPPNRASPSPSFTASASTGVTNTASSFTASSASSAATLSAMAMSGYLQAGHAFRPSKASPSPYNSNMHETPRYGMGAFSGSASPTIWVKIRRLPLNTTEESVRLMTMFTHEQIAEVELLPVEQSEDSGFLSANLRFRTMAGAQHAKSTLDGLLNATKEANMVVEIKSDDSPLAQRYSTDPLSANNSGSPASAASVSSTIGPGQVPRFNNSGFHSLENISPQTNNAYPGHELPKPNSGVDFKNMFSPQSPIGNHLTERGRMSGKDLIAHDSADDDETSNLLKNPLAYAEINNAPPQRRATAPQIPISNMAALSLNTSAMPPPGPSSLPPFNNVMSAQSGPMSPVDKGGFNGYPVAFGRQAFPPVNPADQNPPCNTLYVGNLPGDASEEELKGVFVKQRGYKRLCFRTKQNGPMCFVEFEDVSFATKALHELYGTPLHNSTKGGIRLSFSKNPLGVRSGQAPSHANSNQMGGMHQPMPGSANGFPLANRPPPGLGLTAPPPGLGSGRGYPYMNAGHGNGAFGGLANYGWNGPVYNDNDDPKRKRNLFTGNYPPRHNYMVGK